MGLGRMPYRQAWAAYALLLGWGAACAWANPLVVGSADDASVASEEVSPRAFSTGPTPSMLDSQHDLVRSLPLPALGTPHVDPEAPDPRTAFLTSEHTVQRAQAHAEERPIHIPEPASIVLLTTGAVGLLARRALRRGQGATRG